MTGPAGHSRIRVVIAEDQQLVRSALVSLINDEIDLDVVGECGSGSGVVELVRGTGADVAVLDVDMPGTDGLTACNELRRHVPTCRCLLLTALDKPGLLQRALRCGALGYIVKYAPLEEMLDAIRAVAAGRRSVDPALAVAALGHTGAGVTEREIVLVRLLAEGLQDREIARRMSLSHGTVRNYLSAVMSKVDARNRVDLVRIGQEEGWLLPRR